MHMPVCLNKATLAQGSPPHTNKGLGAVTKREGGFQFWETCLHRNSCHLPEGLLVWMDTHPLKLKQRPRVGLIFQRARLHFALV